ncbi:MAG: methyltransferase domain-containing protein [Planctomycetota bacterium]
MAEHWCRVVMNRETERLVDALGPQSLRVLEVSGNSWSGRKPFASYAVAAYPAYDVCAGPLDASFDLIIAEQVFEHLLWPYRAALNIFEMLDPGGHVLVTTPFLIKRHDAPVDCSRWTETGMKHLLAEVGFDLGTMQTGSWGNRACIEANWLEWVEFRPDQHSLENEPEFPMVVWALARK